MRNGDYVSFNRQPTIHKHSIMAHRVRILPYRLIRMLSIVLFAHNSDFDGESCHQQGRE